MNLFRFIADMLHLGAILTLLYRVRGSRNCIGKYHVYSTNSIPVTQKTSETKASIKTNRKEIRRVLSLTCQVKTRGEKMTDEKN